MTNKNEVLTMLKDHMEDNYINYTEQENIEWIIDLVDEMFRVEINENKAKELYNDLMRIIGK